ncbi:sensor histidine kinase [Anaerotignum propionicum]|uniref:sensor histidine kinase n=1 Tax=Anaerotignum propionicum TaxID=28446 RepID=UPI002109BBDF|nr:sensor histidine kinase [Anaerotignum propionicum]MCQ4935555.1 GHKL domain-containing protein [Anaerotignum propionicum]
MTFTLYFFINLCFSFIMLYIILSFFDSFLGNKTLSNKRFYAYILYLFLKTILFVFPRDIFTNIFVTISSLLLLATLYQSSITKKIIAILYEFSIVMIVEVVVEFGYRFLYQYKEKQLAVNQGSFIFLHAITLFALLILVKLYQHIKSKDVNDGILKPLTLIELFSMPFLSIITLHIFYRHAVFYQNYSNSHVLIALLLFIMNIIFYHLYEKTLILNKVELKNELLSQQIKYYILQYEKEKENLDEVRKIKHDLNHHLLFIQEQLRTCTPKSLAELNEVFTNMLKITSQSETIFYTKNHAINAILNYKISKAETLNIPLEVRVNLSSEYLPDENNLYVIIGNLLDNAIESFDSKNSNLKCITISIYEEKNNLYISVVNPFSKDLHIDHKHPLTSKKNKNLHGFGLQSVSSLVAQHNGYLKLTTDNHTFVVTIILFSFLTKTA